jgi:hypothetical protein
MDCLLGLQFGLARDRHTDQFPLALHLKLAADAGHVGADSFNADLQGTRDFRIGPASAEMPQNVDLARRQVARIVRIVPLNPVAVEGRKHTSALGSEVNRGKDITDGGTPGKTCSSGCEQAHPVIARRIMREDEDSGRWLDQSQPRQRKGLGHLIQDRDPRCKTCDRALKLRIFKIVGEDANAGIGAQHVRQTKSHQWIKATYYDRYSDVLSHAPADVRIAALAIRCWRPQRSAPKQRQATPVPSCQRLLLWGYGGAGALRRRVGAVSNLA